MKKHKVIDAKYLPIFPQRALHFFVLWALVLDRFNLLSPFGWGVFFTIVAILFIGSIIRWWSQDYYSPRDPAIDLEP